MDQKTRAEHFRSQIANRESLEDDWEEEDFQAEELRKSREERVRKRAERMKRQHRKKVIRRLAVTAVTISGIAIIATACWQVLGKPETSQHSMLPEVTSGLSYNSEKTVKAGAPNSLSTAQSEEQDETNSFGEPTTEAITKATTQSAAEAAAANTAVMPSWINQQLLPLNTFSRPGKKLRKVNDIVIHYVGNPGTTGINNRNYFASLADSKANPKGAKASSHFVVGLEGEIIQCVPLEEISYCSNQRNSDTVAIEVCHPDETGKFNAATYSSLVKLTAWLLEHYELDATHIIRHYDVTGKQCPKYFVEHEDAWEQFKKDVAQYMKDNPSIP